MPKRVLVTGAAGFVGFHCGACGRVRACGMHPHTTSSAFMRGVCCLTGCPRVVAAAQRLHARGDVVLGVDNFNSSYSVQLKYDRARELRRQGITYARAGAGCVRASALWGERSRVVS